MLKDLLSFIFLIKGVACNLQTARAGIIFSISSALLPIPLWGLFRGANPPGQPGDRCSRHHGDRRVRAGPVTGRMGCPEADERRVCVCVRSRWGRSSVSIWGFSVSLDLLSQLRELNTFHFFCFIISVLCAGVKSFHVRIHMLRKRQLDSHKLWADYETITLCTDLSEHPNPACCSWLYFTGQLLNIKSDYWHIKNAQKTLWFSHVTCYQVIFRGNFYSFVLKWRE